VIPPDWPPEHHDDETLMFFRDQLSRPGADGWWLHYAVAIEEPTPTLIGSVGYKGPPSEGCVEIGYSVLPAWQRRGLATEASRALIEAAWDSGAHTVIAHTYEHLTPSIRVLQKLGFRHAPAGEPGLLEFRLDRD
jgi:RimJ/RimL family protein N-acetyltransferase